jgi:predicted Zn finger-like uncharacterized protein
MIVACSACSARFRVADEKVGPRGARIRCSRCGQAFAVRPPPPPAPAAAPEPLIGSDRFEPAPPAPGKEVTSTGGWPTGVLELHGEPAADPGTPAAASLEGDPFASFTGAFAVGPVEPTPLGPALHPATGAAAEKPEFLDSLPVTDLSDLERTGALSIAGPGSPEPEFPTFPSDGDLALEERTPAGLALRDGAPRWDDPEATNAVAIGPDGFQEVDLAAGAAPPDPDFDPMEPEPTPAPPARRPAPPPAPPPVVERRADAPASSPPADPGFEPVPGPMPAPATAPVPAAGAPARPEPRAPRFRVLAMNVLSLAALLVVTAGILVWWRGQGIGSLLRWPGVAPRGDVEVGQVSSGVYEGAPGQQVVFVRGVVRATRSPVAGPVLVKVGLERAGATLGAATGAAGAVPSAEQLAGVTSAADLDRLRGELQARAPARLEPGTDLPFLVVLPRPDGDVGAIHFRVEPVPAPVR